MQNEDDQFELGGVYAGTKAGEQVASTLDPAAYDWALTVVQNDGYLQDMDYLDGPWSEQEMGPDTAITDPQRLMDLQEVAQAEPVGISLQGVPGYVLEDVSMVA